MAALHSGPSSAVDSINDLDGYTIRDYNFPSANSFTPVQDDDFGFDPPAIKAGSLNNYQVYSPPTDLSLPDWPDFQREDDLKPSTEMPLNLDAYEMDKFINSTLPNPTTAVARFGQMTPPRSNSAASTDSVKFEEKALSPKSMAPEAPRRKRSKAQPKEEAPAPGTSTTNTPGRKRKSSKKASVSERSESPEEQKRKQSLEKNRLAAAKCRMNKKEKTEQLQRDSHDKAVQNAYLKDQVMRMKDEIQQMNAILLAHANCEGCKSPEEIQAHLSHLGNDFFSSHMSMGASNFGDFSQMSFPDLSMMPDSYFASANPNPMLNPPLPEFNRTGEFEVHTPMHTD